VQHLDLGQAAIQPDGPVVAGSTITLTYTYTCGHPIDDRGYIKIAFRDVGDYGTPQFDDPAAPNYCAIHTTGDCTIRPRWDPKGNTRAWSRALYLQVTRGYLDRGQQIVVVFGDTRGGSPGWRVQSFREHSFEFRTYVDPIATFQFKQLPASPELGIVAGEPARAVCIAPSNVQVGESFVAYLKLEDRWGNPTRLPAPVEQPGYPQPGVYTVTLTDADTGLAAESNPIEVQAQTALAKARPVLRPYWGDLHGQTEETCGSNSIEDYFSFARDHGLLDITAHQGNDFEVSDAFWETVNQTTRRYYQPGAFVTFPGYEWSGNTPLGGDRNVYFCTEGGRIVHSCTDLLPGQTTVHPIARTARELFDVLRAQEGPRPFAYAHVGGRYADMAMHDPEVELAVEVHSAWGTFEWLVEDALRLGYRIGICANSDGHKTRPGASYPGAGEFGSLGGLTCILAQALNREHVLEALVRRHFYATTGNRPLLDVQLTTDAPHSCGRRRTTMGDAIELNAGSPCLHVRAVGTGAVERIEVRNGLETIAVYSPYTDGDLGDRVKITWSGGEVRGRARLVSWHGGLTVEGNRIAGDPNGAVTPINFWNADRPLQQVSETELAWRSITTGGLSGVILTLSEPGAGTLHIRTEQGQVECPVSALGLEPRTWSYGGLRKELSIHRLPARPTREIDWTLPLADLHPGDNPIYVKLVQEDGHMAWTSPIYVVREE
jgi:hypothetical protein